MQQYLTKSTTGVTFTIFLSKASLFIVQFNATFSLSNKCDLWMIHHLHHRSGDQIPSTSRPAQSNAPRKSFFFLGCSFRWWLLVVRVLSALRSLNALHRAREQLCTFSICHRNCTITSYQLKFHTSIHLWYWTVECIVALMKSKWVLRCICVCVCVLILSRWFHFSELGFETAGSWIKKDKNRKINGLLCWISLLWKARVLQEFVTAKTGSVCLPRKNAAALSLSLTCRWSTSVCSRLSRKCTTHTHCCFLSRLQAPFAHLWIWFIRSHCTGWSCLDLHCFSHYICTILATF